MRDRISDTPLNDWLKYFVDLEESRFRDTVVVVIYLSLLTGSGDHHIPFILYKGEPSSTADGPIRSYSVSWKSFDEKDGNIYRRFVGRWHFTIHKLSFNFDSHKK